VSITTISGLAFDQAVSAKDLTYITEQYPPYNYQENGRLQGISVDLLERIWERIGVDLNRSVIKVLPWTDGYQTTLKENNTVLFTTFRIPEREQLFKWVGPIASGRDVLLAKSNKNITITTLEDLKKYKIAGIENDIAVERLLNDGVKKENLVLEKTSASIIAMLKNGTIDAWAYNDLAGLWLIKQSGANASDYKVAYVLAQGDGYFTFNKKTSDSIVQSFQQALDSIKNNRDSSGVSDYEKILTKYIPAAYIASNTKQNETKAFLDEAVAYLKENGQQKAFQVFNNHSGLFVRGDLYIFGYDLNGTCIVHPINASLIGQKGLSDADGVDIVGRELTLASRGGGTLYIVFPNQAHEDKPELKQLYIETVNNSFYLGSGLYLSNISASFNKSERDALVAYVNNALQFAKKNGKQKALAVFNDPKGNFTRDGLYIFAYDYNGKNLALPFQPDLVGTNRVDARDPNGVDFVRQSIDLARIGSGFHYYVYPDPSRNMTPELKLSYVTNVDGTWFLGAGIYTNG
jgi:ABC-type amino acid transport substrate-binding protein